jgi:hypothetical protein
MKAIRNLVISLLLVMLLLWGGYAKVNGVRAGLINWETKLSAKYSSNQATLSTYVTGYAEMLGIADRKADKLNEILIGAVQGRYDQPNAPQIDSGKLFSAIQEAYPSVDLTAYDRILDLIQAKREQFRSNQTELQEMVAAYNSKRTGDIINSAIANGLGFPSKQLEARIGNDVIHGQAALDRISRIVSDATTSQAFGSGTMAPLVPGDNK